MTSVKLDISIEDAQALHAYLDGGEFADRLVAVRAYTLLAIEQAIRGAAENANPRAAAYGL